MIMYDLALVGALLDIKGNANHRHNQELTNTSKSNISELYTPHHVSWITEIDNSQTQPFFHGTLSLFSGDLPQTRGQLVVPTGCPTAKQRGRESKQLIPFHI